MKKTLSFISAAALAASAFALPSVTDVSFTQADDGEVTVSYTLANGPAIITADFLTNGVSIGQANFTTLYGDVNAKVTVNGVHTFRWLPYRDLPALKIDAAVCKAAVTAWPEANPPEVIVLNLASNAAQHLYYYPSVEALPGGLLSNYNYRTMMLPFKKVHAKNRTFTFGTPIDTPERNTSTGYRTVTFLEDYWMSVFELTQGQVNVIRCAKGRSAFGNVMADIRPASHAGTGEFREGSITCANNFRDAAYRYPHSPHPDSWSGRVHGLTGLWIEMPSDAQWQYACLAGLEYGWMGHSVTNTKRTVGTDTNYSFDDNYAKLGRCKYNGGHIRNPDGSLTAPNGNEGPERGGTAVCGSFPPNPWGFYDFYGNLQEVVLDECVGYNKATSGQDPHGEPYRNSAWDTDETGRKHVCNSLGTWNGNCNYGQGSFGTGGVAPDNQHNGYRLVYRVNQAAKYTDL